MDIGITSNLQQIIREMEGLGGQYAFATAVAMTKTSKEIEAAVYAEIERKWDRPTPFSRRSLFVKPARKDRLVSSVEIKDRFPSKATYSPDETYQHQYFGGVRKRKSIERYATQAGLISSNEWLVPASYAKLDAYGNMARGQVAQIMSQIRLGLDLYAWKTNSRRSKANQKKAGVMFWSYGGHLKRGVWMRDGQRDVVPIMLVVKSLSYTPTIDINAIGRRVATARFERNLEAALKQAKATAK